jgi:sec-independent protein translocase protein TatC
MKTFLRIISWPFRALFWLILLPFRIIFWFLLWLVRPIANRIRQGRLYHFMTVEPEDRPVVDVFADVIQDPAQLFPHIEAMRAHLLRAVLMLVLTVSASFFFTEQLVNFLAQPVGGLDKLVAIEVTESVSVFMRVALLAGMALASPYIAFEIWWLFAEGLRARARQLGLIAIPVAAIFFVGGMAFAYFVMLPAALPFLMNFLGIVTQPRPDPYFRFVTGIMFWIGISFEFPLVIFAISAMGLITPKPLLKQWRLAVVIIAVIAAAITPTVDPINMGIVMAPMIGLYFLSIGLSALAWSLRKREVEPPETAAV